MVHDRRGDQLSAVLCELGFYYGAITNMFVILGLTVPPCLVFFFFALDKRI